MNKRLARKQRAAEDVCRELRILLSRDGAVTGGNADDLMKHLMRWMRNSGQEKYLKPGEKNEVQSE